MFKGMIYYYSKYKHNVYNNSFRTIITNLNHIPSTLLLIRLKTTSSKALESKTIPKKERCTRWTKDEFETLENAVKNHGKVWCYISRNYFNNNRSPRAMSSKWNRELKLPEKAVEKHQKNLLKKPENSKLKDLNNTKKNTIGEQKTIKNSRNLWWTKKELKTLEEAVEKHGYDWEFISKNYFQKNRTSRAISDEWVELRNIELLSNLIKEHGTISQLMNRSRDSVTHEKREKNIDQPQSRLNRKKSYYFNFLIHGDYDELRKLIDKYDKDWSKIINRSKNSVLKQYLFVKFNKNRSPLTTNKN
jgi:hypothetical protein